MSVAVYMIAILGCGEGELPCQEVRVAETRYQSQAQCQAATEAQLIRHGDLPYPVVVAQCRQAGTAVRPVQPAEVMTPEPEANRHFPAVPRRS